MKLVKPLIIAGALALVLPSCFLFRSKHESCPAYGQEIKNQNEKQVDVKLEENKLSEEA
jgi:hypothetical protein